MIYISSFSFHLILKANDKLAFSFTVFLWKSTKHLSVDRGSNIKVLLRAPDWLGAALLLDHSFVALPLIGKGCSKNVQCTFRQRSVSRNEAKVTLHVKAYKRSQTQQHPEREKYIHNNPHKLLFCLQRKIKQNILHFFCSIPAHRHSDNEKETRTKKASTIQINNLKSSPFCFLKRSFGKEKLV